MITDRSTFAAVCPVNRLRHRGIAETPLARDIPPSSTSPAEASASSYPWPYTRSVIAGSWPSHFAVADSVVPLSSIRVAAVCQVSCNRITGKPAAPVSPLSRSVGTADVVPVTGRCRLFVNCAVGLAASWPGQRTSRTLLGVCNFTARPRGATTMQTDAHNMGHEERRALLEQRRAAVARQLRRLAIELTDLDRQLDEIEQSER
jgi:hypothetical protein